MGLIYIIKKKIKNKKEAMLTFGVIVEVVRDVSGLAYKMRNQDEERGEKWVRT